MANVTLSIPDDLLLESRAYAQKMGKSLNQMIRDYLQNHIGKNEDKVINVEAIRNLVTIDTSDYKWNRDEANER